MKRKEKKKKGSLLIKNKQTNKKETQYFQLDFFLKGFCAF